MLGLLQMVRYRYFIFIDHYLMDRPRGRDRIELSSQARAHTLFPLLDFIASKVAQQHQKFAVIESKQAKLENDLSEIKRVQEELQQLMQQTSKSTFSLKDSGFEV